MLRKNFLSAKNRRRARALANLQEQESSRIKTVRELRIERATLRKERRHLVSVSPQTDTTQEHLKHTEERLQIISEKLVRLGKIQLEIATLRERLQVA